jgi:hypothetical protein
LDHWGSLQQQPDGAYYTLQSQSNTAARLPCESFQVVAPAADNWSNTSAVALSAAVDALSSRCDDVTVYFVVPPDSFDRIKANADLGSSVEQHVLEMPLSLTQRELVLLTDSAES